MSNYTDAASRPGRKGASGTDPRQLFLTEFGGMVMTAYLESMDYGDLHFVKSITQGKADTFPVIGRKRDATEHQPGEIILGGRIDSDEINITVDNMLIDSVFIAEIDELLSHFQFAEPYATQIGQSLGTTNDRRIAIMHILASRAAAATGPGQPVPAYYAQSDLRTNAAKLEEAAFQSVQYLLENDMSGEKPQYMLPYQQVLILARYAGLDKVQSSGSGDRSLGTIGQLAGLQPKGTNHLPRTAITTGLAKYQGDFSTTVGHISSRMAVGTLERRAMKMVMKDQDDRLGTLLIGSMLNGHGTLRNECSIELRTDAIGGRAQLGTYA